MTSSAFQTNEIWYCPKCRRATVKPKETCLKCKQPMHSIGWVSSINGKMEGKQ